jgi:hypothetical protein
MRLLRFGSLWMGILILLHACSSPKSLVLFEDPVTGEVVDLANWDSPYNYTGMDEAEVLTHVAVERYVHDLRSGELRGNENFNAQMRIDSIRVHEDDSLIVVSFDPRFAENPIRPETIAVADSVIRMYLPKQFEDFNIQLFSMGYKVEELIPVYYTRGTHLEGKFNEIHPITPRNAPGSTSQSPSFERGTIAPGNTAPQVLTRLPKADPAAGFTWIRPLDRPWSAPRGLDARHIAIWHSHGWYYNAGLDRWEWQRPRLFGTVEDMLPMAFVLPYVMPMLENAGAYVWNPRERDTQPNEVVVDNDRDLQAFSENELPTTGSVYTEISVSADHGWRAGNGLGFNRPLGPISGQRNPFREGTYRVTVSDTIETTLARWEPDIPETGEYAVYISYASTDSSVTDAHYRVYHAGGSTSFLVNQRIAGGTWIYLGHFRFEEGRRYAVEVSNRSETPGLVVSADGVRFGGGMGIVERGGRTSNRPRFLEGARYNLQYAGMPDSLVWKLNEANDYNDDFQGRWEWVNFLRGAPYGPNVNRETGLGVPVEVSVAFHTDAGVTLDDRIVGTLAIYSVPDMNFNSGYPDGQSRLANRDLTDLMQTQIVDDIRALYDTTWVRRRLWNSRYSEAARPNVPSVLLELLSHQNMRDMEYAMDPRFRFDVSRAIYKSILRFVSSQHGIDYQIQPLPVTRLRAQLEGNSVRLQWAGVSDPLEPTAEPDRFVVYTRIEDGGFDNGLMVTDSMVVIGDLEPGVVYSFMVRAANDGGVSMPSEVISVLYQGSARNAMVVNGFTRVGPPQIIKKDDFRGFASFLDSGVPDRFDIGHVGEQVNFNLRDEWIENDNPGHGMSMGNMETEIFAGNTFDFARIHVDALKQSGMNVVTVSESAVEAGLVSPAGYSLINVMLGKQRQMPNQSGKMDEVHGYQYAIYGPGMRNLLTVASRNGTALLVSGAHVGTDLIHRPVPDSTTRAFARQILRYDFTANHASKSGVVSLMNRGRQSTPGALQPIVRFNTEYSRDMYRVDAPDAIKPIGDSGRTWLRYTENEFSAGVVATGRNYRSMVLGFPFETVLGQEERRAFMKEILTQLGILTN